MESDILLEGFLEAESTHGLHYMRIIGDGDPSVMWPPFANPVTNIHLQTVAVLNKENT